VKASWAFLSTIPIFIMVSKTVIAIFLLLSCSALRGQYLSKDQLLELIFADTSGLHKDTVSIAKNRYAVLYIDSVGNTRIDQIFSQNGVCESTFCYDKDGNWSGFSFSLDSLENTKSYSFHALQGKVNYEFYENHAIESISTFNHKKQIVLQEWFYENGNINAITIYEDTNATIAFNKRYFEHGVIFEEGILYNGQRAGIWKVYKRNGKLKRKVDYGDWTQLN
jgi:antitoxin component YwqK of YwqJK toxin-antitoxin module